MVLDLDTLMYNSDMVDGDMVSHLGGQDNEPMLQLKRVGNLTFSMMLRPTLAYLYSFNKNDYRFLFSRKPQWSFFKSYRIES